LANPTPGPSDFRAQLSELRRQLDERIDRISTFDATQMNRAIETLTQLVNDLPGQIDEALATAVNTGNVTATGTVSAGGAVSGSTGTFHGGVKSTDVYNRLVSGSPYKVQYVDSSGQMGYVPSSRRYKRDIVTATLDVRSIMAELRVVTFRYLGAVELSGKEAAVEWGVIAEEIHDLGLTWLVDYNEEGNPDGVKHERFAILLILAAKDQQAQIDDIDSRLALAGF
jgi:hypothetical protein